MSTLHMEYITMLGAFAIVFPRASVNMPKIVFMGAILSLAERNVIAFSHVMDLSRGNIFKIRPLA